MLLLLLFYQRDALKAEMRQQRTVLIFSFCFFLFMCSFFFFKAALFATGEPLDENTKP
jgi:hypothetical protein